MSDHAQNLRQAADEIRREGHAGWGNTCEWAADELERLTAERNALRDDNAKLNGWMEEEAQAAGRLQRKLNAAEEEIERLTASLKRANETAEHFERHWYLRGDEIERLAAERDNARERFELTANLLMSIHALLYPPPVTLPDGRTFVFRPEDPDPHTVLQTLSDRIRALPDEIAAINDAKEQR